MTFRTTPLRRLLELDRPVPSRSEVEVAREAAENYRWNFAVNVLDGASFWLGLSFISSATIVPLFINQLTTSPYALGLAAMIAQGSWYLPQLLTANYVERLPRKKPVVVNLGFFLERLPMWLIVASALLALAYPLLALVLFLFAYAWHGLGAGLIATAWQDLLARCFPVHRRGRLLGLTLFIGAGTGAAGAFLSSWLLETYPFPTNFVYAFFLAAFFITASWFFLALVREPVQEVSAPRVDNRSYLASLPLIVRQDHNYRRFLVARLLLALGGMGTGFIAVAAVRRWQLADSVGGLYTVAYLAGQTIGNLLFGLLADRRGHKLSLEISALCALLAFTVAWFAPSPAWVFLVFVLIGCSVGGTIVSGILVVLEFSSPQKRPTYAGLTNTAVGLVSISAPLVGAWLAGHDYSWVFAVSAVANLLALLAMRYWVREPRHTAVAETVSP